MKTFFSFFLGGGSEFEVIGWITGYRLLFLKKMMLVFEHQKISEPDLFLSPPPPPLFIFSRLSYQQLHIERALIAIFRKDLFIGWITQLEEKKVCLSVELFFFFGREITVIELSFRPEPEIRHKISSDCSSVSSLIGRRARGVLPRARVDWY